MGEREKMQAIFHTDSVYYACGGATHPPFAVLFDWLGVVGTTQRGSSEKFSGMK